MKLAVISDIHGNHYALNEVLKDASKTGIEMLLVLGDIVGYYYHPEKVLDLLAGWRYEIIKGNHEAILQDLQTGKLVAEEVKKKYGSGHQLALKNLDEKSLQRLFSLPEQKEVIIDNTSIQLNHGAPWSINEYLYPDTGKEKLEQCDAANHDFVLIGHSHYSFSYRCAHCTLINCGSVGQSRQKGGLANWAVINTANKSFEMRATPYDTAELLNEIKLIDPEAEYLSKILVR